MELDQFHRAGRDIVYPRPVDIQDLMLYEVTGKVIPINFGFQTKQSGLVFCPAAFAAIRNVGTGKERDAVLVTDLLTADPDYIQNGQHFVAYIRSGMQSEVCMRVVAAFERGKLPFYFKHRIVAFGRT